LTPHLAHAVRTIKDRIDALLGPEPTGGAPTPSTFTPSSPEMGWRCEWQGHMPDEASCLYCGDIMEEGA